MTELYQGDQPDLQSARGLTMRALSPADEQYLVEYAGDTRVAESTLNIPFPYTAKDAQDFIKLGEESWKTGKDAIFGIISPDAGHLVGCIGLMMDPENRTGELGYWIGPPYWGRGYASECAKRVIEFGFEDLSLLCIHGNAFSSNTGSIRVLQKSGMSFEGRARSRIQKGKTRHDLDHYSILIDEYHARIKNEEC
ncbi:hypothetical protein CAPTEDRAFT_154123 [Capitella teleta]|uniref:N-acetyltransferase domain-containing protein n=1 Tax=Capitella teleta TaxID=283909 RepID=R7T765_CAPTE|nr:hypothetical protein CAPTEDRAFT_154123 [Capitella teleta]|eukprot:ELT89484.1 hypothetical protein CAPTEDRAFT_154123 [Capitella teleta]